MNQRLELITSHWPDKDRVKLQALISDAERETAILEETIEQVTVNLLLESRTLKELADEGLLFHVLRIGYDRYKCLMEDLKGRGQ